MFLSFWTFQPSYIFIYSFEMSSTIKSRLQQKIKEKEEKKQSEIIKLKELIYNGNADNRIIKCGDHVNFNFNKNTGKFVSITDGAYIIVPDELTWLKTKDILMKSVNEIGGIFIIKPEEMPGDDYPDTVSFILVEKVNYTDRLSLKIIIKLSFDDIFIKSKDLLGVIYSNINSFWLILKSEGKGEKQFRLVYYYRPDYKALDIKTVSEEYSYTDISIKKGFICSLSSTFNITPSVIYMITYDENDNIIILQYTILNHKSLFPKIFLYDTDTTLYERGKYISYCVNHNISLFSVILELPNKEKCFYTGIVSLSDPDKFKHSEIKLEITEANTFPPNISLLQCETVIYKIMRDTEINMIKMTLLENRKDLERKKMLKSINDRELKEKLAKNASDKLLAEENAKKEKEEKDKKEIIKKQIAESKRLEEESKRREEESKRREEESKRILDINYMVKCLLDNIIDNAIDNVMDKVTESDILIETVLDNTLDKILFIVIEKAIDKYKFIENRKFKRLKMLEYKKELELIDEKAVETPVEKAILSSKQIEDETLKVFIHNMYVVNPQVADALKNAETKDIYVSILFNNRFIIMHEIDNIVINHPYILKIKDILDNKIDKSIDITALYGSYLSIIYALALNSIGYPFNPFSKYENPLYEVDIDTMSISLLSDEDISYGYEFHCNKPTIISYHTDIQPVQNTNIKTSSIDTLLNNCWDINSTSAILLFEKNSPPHIMRNPDFTEFLFGIQPIKPIFGKNQYNLYNPESTNKRLVKAKKKWY